MEKDKLFIPNADKLLYTITIDVYNNCANLGISNNNDYEPKYHEVIGTLETQKQNLVWKQREINTKAFNDKNIKSSAAKK